MELHQNDESVSAAADTIKSTSTPAISRKIKAIQLLNNLNLKIVDEKHPDWAVESTAYNLRIPVIPAIVVYVDTAKQVQETVTIAVSSGLKVNARCGGHSYASLGQGGEDGHLIIDLTKINRVVVDADTQIATVGAGARLGHLALQLYQQGGRAIAHGSCPGVGISGHILHGGYGWISHNRGLALDWLVGADIVLANGTQVHCSKTNSPDLFWALRGAGSNFGIVTSYELETFPAPVISTPFKVPLKWHTEQQKIDGVKALVDFARTAPAELNMRLGAHNSGDHAFEGVYYGTVDKLYSILRPLIRKTGDGKLEASPGTWMQGLLYYAERQSLSIPDPYIERGNFYATSLTLKDMSGESLSNFVHHWQTKAIGFQPGGWFFQLDLHGGPTSAVSAVTNPETAYAHRDKAILIQLYHYIDNEVPYPAEAVDLMKGFVTSTTAPLKDGDWGMYVNYVDSELDYMPAEKLYYGDNLDRLKNLKKRYDPTQVFYYPQSIAPAE